MMNLEFRGMEVKNLSNGYHRLKVIRQLEVEHGINIFDPQTPTKTEMDDSFYKLVKTVFRTKRAKPTNAKELIEFYGALIKSATCRKFVNVSKGQVKVNTECPRTLVPKQF